MAVFSTIIETMPQDVNSYGLNSKGRVRVFIAQSLDGFISGPDHDISWLPHPRDDDCGWHDFISGIGCALMGRNTYDAMIKMGAEWPHTSLDTIVATTRHMSNVPPRVFSARGDIRDLVDKAHSKAGGKDVYIDGGDLIKQAIDADLVSDICVSVVPIIIGSGSTLFAGCRRRHHLHLVAHRQLPMGMYQLSYTTKEQASSLTNAE